MPSKPWKISADKPWCIIDEKGAVISRTTPDCAAMMVREHNAHAALVNALQKARTWVVSSNPGEDFDAEVCREDIDAALKLAGE